MGESKSQWDEGSGKSKKRYKGKEVYLNHHIVLVEASKCDTSNYCFYYAASIARFYTVFLLINAPGAMQNMDSFVPNLQSKKAVQYCISLCFRDC